MSRLNTEAVATIVFQRDGGWWYVWTAGPDAALDSEYHHSDAYVVSDDMNDAEEPRATVVADVLERWNDGQPFPIMIIDPGVACDDHGLPILSHSTAVLAQGAAQ